MKFKTLGQEKYKDSNGHEISSDVIDFIAPYKHVADGFYNWECGGCSDHQSGRDFIIAGQVLKCNNCGKMNLLVKTCTDEIDKWFGKNVELERREEELKLKEKNLSEYVHKSTWEKTIKELEDIKKFAEGCHINLDYYMRYP